ncbi:hypothetical protein ACNSOO_04570 [Aliarcobacter lanthieri]|uniref:hypothetical protein n=1 Tax=Aliarcobacter lanthieri TaxID=1355374 RepID=UPI003AAB15B4
MQEKNFIAFYTKPPFWLEDKREDVELNKNNLQEQMSKEVIVECNEDFTIKVMYDGLIQISINSIEESIKTNNSSVNDEITNYNNYMNHINAFYLMIIIKTMEPRVKEIELDGTLQSIISQGIGPMNFIEIFRHDTFRIFKDKNTLMNLPSYHFATILYNARTNENPIFINNSIYQRNLISSDVIKNAISLYKKHFRNKKLISLLASFTKSIAEHKVGNYDTSIILAWTIAENILNNLYQNRQNKRISSYSKNINNILCFLRLYNLITQELYELSNKVRKFRNDIAHSNNSYVSSNEDTKNALDCVSKLLKFYYQIDVPVPSGVSYNILY